MKYDFLSYFNDYQISLICHHIENRTKYRSEKSGLGIVYDVTHLCNLRCRGCAVNAKQVQNEKAVTSSDFESSFEDVILVLTKIKEFTLGEEDLDFFINFGGGEPFLRDDFINVLKISKHLFGSASIGVDTNGTIVTTEQLYEISQLISYLGVSIDGLESYHNWWRGHCGSPKIESVFKKTIETIKASLEIPNLKDKVEVSSVMTKRNIDQLPELLKFLSNLGVKKYSVKRPMPVGRLSNKPEWIPDAIDYLNLLTKMTEINVTLGMDIHFHHTLESIYAALLLNNDSYQYKIIGAPDKRSSICIGPRGKVYFDPWCMVPPWNHLCLGDLLNDKAKLADILNGEKANLIQSYCRQSIRCFGCRENCSGGSRIAAAASYLISGVDQDNQKITLENILHAMTAKDPACPMPNRKNREKLL